jgi:protein O-mannosyl-transferase
VAERSVQLSETLIAEPASPRPIVPLLIVITILTFVGVLWCDFVNFDDPTYITQNVYVRQGLTPQTISWALTHRIQDLYDPMTVLSFALEVQVFGLNPGGFHLDNLLLHTANVLLLYKLLERMTGAPWRSALVAAVWAVHPLRVESVAWVMERKDVLMAFWGLMALHVYVSNVRHRRLWMAPAIGLLLVFSLLSKPALVILPALLLLLDIWPLGRTTLWRPEESGTAITWAALIREKFLLIGICGVAIAMYLRGSVGLTHPMNVGEPVELGGRLQNAIVSYGRYLLMMIDFRNLSVFYPIPPRWEAWRWIGSALVLAAITAMAIAGLKRRPWIAVGWIWFLIALLPVAGIVSPINHASPADRFTYLPSIGLLIAIVWMLPFSWGQTRAKRFILGIVVTVILILMASVTAVDVTHWRDSSSLWRQALDATHDNWLAECEYALAIEGDGHPDEAMVHFLASVRINSQSAQAHFNYGGALERRGELRHALSEYQKSLALYPAYGKASLAAGTLLMQVSQFATAADVYSAAARFDPLFIAPAHCCRGASLLQRNQPQDAIVEFEQALAAQGDYGLAHTGLGVALLKSGQPAAAIEQFQAAQKLNPNDPAIQQNLEAATRAQSTQPSGNTASTRN